mgnify:FL=1|tara:strand:+ start:365 stop:721 length:357 start_codon:yes stop_codon:yes gene_type:complete
MSILSDLGEFLGKKFSLVNKDIQENRETLISLGYEIAKLKSEIEDLKASHEEYKIKGTNIPVDLNILAPNKGVTFETETGNRYRIRIDDNKKLIIDDILNNESNIAEIQLTINSNEEA